MFILIDKPKGITSHDVIGKVRRVTGERCVGHAGTLDPNATGLLIVGVGRQSTRCLWEKFGKLTKTYLGEITLGEERTTDDSEGVVRPMEIGIKSKLVPTKKQILKVLKSFLGEQDQVPPNYSAVKIAGKKAYQIARKNLDFAIEPRKIKIFSIKLSDYQYPIVRIETNVSSGTYIRALARDIGRRLVCGAYLSNLRRTRIGTYRVDEATPIDKLELENLSFDKSKAEKLLISGINAYY